MKNLGQYHDLYAQCDTYLLADMFENFRNMCLDEYGLDPAFFLCAPGLAELLTDIDTLFMVEKGTKGGIFQEIHRYEKANNKYMKNYAKNNESSYIEYVDANNLYGWAMSQKLPVNGF